MVIVHRGRLVFERYGGLLPQWDKPGKPVVRDTPLLSWSMAKSMLHAVVGMLVDEGRLVLDDPAPVPRVAVARATRAARSPCSTCWTCATGSTSSKSTRIPKRPTSCRCCSGGARPTWPPSPPTGRWPRRPGTRFNYSSGTSNVISGIVARTVGPGEPYREFLARRLFEPLGMTSATVDPR